MSANIWPLDKWGVTHGNTFLFKGAYIYIYIYTSSIVTKYCILAEDISKINTAPPLPWFYIYSQNDSRYAEMFLPCCLTQLSSRRHYHSLPNPVNKFCPSLTLHVVKNNPSCSDGTRQTKFPVVLSSISQRAELRRFCLGFFSSYLPDSQTTKNQIKSP